MDLTKIIEAVRSSTFGGLVLAGLGIIAYYTYPLYLAKYPFYWFTFACFLLGTAINKMIGKILGYLFFNRPQKVISFHDQLSEIDKLFEEKRISPTMYQHLVNKICEKRYLE